MKNTNSSRSFAFFLRSPPPATIRHTFPAFGAGSARAKDILLEWAAVKFRARPYAVAFALAAVATAAQAALSAWWSVRGGGPGPLHARHRWRRAARAWSGRPCSRRQRHRWCVPLEGRPPFAWRNARTGLLRRELGADGGDPRFELAGPGACGGPFVQGGSGHLHRGGGGLSGRARPGRPSRGFRIPLCQSRGLRHHAPAFERSRGGEVSGTAAGGAKSPAALSAVRARVRNRKDVGGSVRARRAMVSEHGGEAGRWTRRDRPGRYSLEARRRGPEAPLGRDEPPGEESARVGDSDGCADG